VPSTLAGQPLSVCAANGNATVRTAHKLALLFRTSFSSTGFPTAMIFAAFGAPVKLANLVE
jgi:hypothetical protein